MSNTDSLKAQWAEYHELNDKNIDKEIPDTTNTQKKVLGQPKVSVPSPFARFDLVQEAFGNVAKQGATADHRDALLVSHALDVAQLFYELDSHPEISVVTWEKKAALDQLNRSVDEGNRLLGESLEMYMRQENYGFNEEQYYSATGTKWDDMAIHIFTFEGDPVGCTSPCSLFMASPNFDKSDGNPGKFAKILIDGDVPIFSKVRQLAERDQHFVEFIFRTVLNINSHPGSWTISPLHKFIEYIESQRKCLAEQNRALYAIVNELDGKEDNDLASRYKESDYSVLGYTLYMRRQENIEAKIEKESYFTILSNKTAQGERLPLVLTNNCRSTNWPYYSANTAWNIRKHSVNYADPQRSVLPGTEIEYPWLCENDLLADVLVQLPYNLDSDHFFNGNLISTADDRSYLLPIKSEFFHYFDYTYLLESHSVGEPNFKIEEKGKNAEIVEVTLRIPVKNGQTQVLKRTYEAQNNPSDAMRSISLNKEESVGYILEYPLALSIFPFIRTPKNNYQAMRLSRIGSASDIDMSLTAFTSNLTHAGETQQKQGEDSRIDMQAETGRNRSTYFYAVTALFDYLVITLVQAGRSHQALLLPKWEKTPYQGNAAFRYGFDFGTSNSYVAVENLNANERETRLKTVSLSSSIVSTYPSGSKAKGNLMQLTSLRTSMQQEFLPEQIGREFGLPTRTAIITSKNFDDTRAKTALLHANIPFVYGKEDFGEVENKIKLNLKWQRDKAGRTYTSAFIEELALLARGYALENDARLEDCRFVWTYPLSMNGAAVNEFEMEWKRCYKKFFCDDVLRSSADAEIVSKISESVAPILYYRDNKQNLNQMSLSVDIGGGTCDVLIFKNNEHIKVTSFRFGADTVFGAGTVATNQMMQRFCIALEEKLKTRIDPDCNAMKILRGVRMNTSIGSAEASSMLFSLASHADLMKVDLNDKSYNSFLQTDSKSKIVFLYYYAAIIYYLTRLLKDNDYPTPWELLFSGMGSKLLNIISVEENLERLTKAFIAKFSEGQYTYAMSDMRTFKITIEQDAPKQVTARGVLCKEPDAKRIASLFSNIEYVEENTTHYSSIRTNDGAPMLLTYKDLFNNDVQNAIINEVERFNNMFIELSKELNFVNNYGCDLQSLKVVEQTLNLNLKPALDTRIGKLNKDEFFEESIFEDVPFFYPIQWKIAELIALL